MAHPFFSDVPGNIRIPGERRISCIQSFFISFYILFFFFQFIVLIHSLVQLFLLAQFLLCILHCCPTLHEYFSDRDAGMEF